MGLWDKIKKWFSIPKRNFPDSHHPSLYPLNVDDIAKELKLEENAQRFGEKGIPPPDATTLDGTEEKIVQKIGKVCQDYINWASFRLHVIDSALAPLDVTQAINQALQADKEFERKADVLFAEFASSAGPLAEIAKRNQQELEAFREKHKLERTAKVLRPTQRFLGYLVLIVLIIVEGVVNASFFSQGMTSGLLGGFSYAAAFAFVNLIVAFSWGKFAVPFVFHNNAIQKMWGYLGVVAAMLCMISISLMIAHYRNALIAEAIDPARVGWAALSTNPFSLSDILSWGLFAVSLVFAMLALLDGLASDDIYPGYGRVTERVDTARAVYMEEISALRKQLGELKNDHLAMLSGQLDQAQAYLAQRSGFILGKIEAESRLKIALNGATQCLKALLAIYRNTNKLYRNGLPIPAYFDQPIQLENLALPNFSTKADEAIKVDQQVLVESLLAKMDVLRGNIQAAFNQTYDRLKPLDAHFERDLS